MSEKIWLSSPHIGDAEFKFVKEAFETNWIAPLGPHVNAFEKEISALMANQDVAVLTSGTAAIHLALILLGVKEGDEVICSSFTFAASANPIIYQHATPVFIDSEPDTWNMSPVLLEEAICDRIKAGKKPRAIIIVHLYGMPAKMNEILKIAGKYDIPIIEDAAEALGSRYYGEPVGTLGKFSVLSFNGNKIITTSGGGALLSNDQALINKARFLATQARDEAPHYQHSEIGYNYRMSNVLAGIGRGQLMVLEERISQKRAVFESYQKNLGDLEGINFLSEPSGAFSNRWLTTILINPIISGGITRETIRLALNKDNIESRPLWKPMHLQPVFADYFYLGEGVSDRLFENGLCLPSGSNLTANEMDRICSIVRRIYKQ